MIKIPLKRTGLFCSQESNRHRIVDVWHLTHSFLRQPPGIHLLLCDQDLLGFPFLFLGLGWLGLWENGVNIIVFFILHTNDEFSRFKRKLVVSMWIEEIWLIQVNIGSFALNFGVQSNENKDDPAWLSDATCLRWSAHKSPRRNRNSREPRPCKMKTRFFFSNSKIF